MNAFIQNMPTQRKLAVIILLAFIVTQMLARQSPALAQIEPACILPANKIVAENCLPGNPPSEWDVSGAGDLTIQGFATEISVNRGQTVDFKIDTTAAAYEIKIYRLGYYSGNGARLIATIPSANVIATDQPACTFDAANRNLLDCGNWTVSASWQTPVDATSGVYIAKPTRTDNGGASHIVFIVRDDASASDVLFQTSDTTWQAYNPYGGYNAYGSSGATMAEKLSYNRPFTTRGAELENWLFNAEYPMIRWLERNGYDVSYTSAIDIERRSTLITNHEIFLSVGHDEYWSQGRRDAVTAARDAGVHLAFFSGNEIYWKIRWEDSGSQPYRTQVTYKEGSAAPSGSAEHRNCYNNYECDPSDIWTGLWREAVGFTPENSLSGQISWRLNTGSITVPGEYAPLRFWRNTAVASLEPTGQVTLANGTLGYEWDPEYPQYADWYPAGRVLLSTTNVTSFVGPEQHHLSLYRATSGALVFGAGTVQWSWGLDDNHDRDASVEDPNVQQATVNLFADMGVQPTTLQANLVAAAASTDTTPPVVTVTSPSSGSSAPGGAVTITGTATDTGGVVGVVEISTNGGTTWRRASGRENWSYTYSALEGTAAISVRAADDSINLSATTTHTFNVEPRICPCSLWNDATIPTTPYKNDGQPIEVGMKFQASEAGMITGLRFYKGSANNGTHTGHLWAADGAQLAEAIFTNETTSGWQEVYFPAPVEILPDTTYVASYHSSNGGYAFDDGYFATAYASAPLRALADGEVGANGVYKTGASGFPTLTYQSSNYWVDVIFDNTPQTYSIWEQGTITGSPAVNDPSPVELGMKFKSDVPGSVTGIAFYKGATNTGPFLGHLWTLGGVRLAEKSYANNTSDEGWQVITFDTAVPISATTTYVVSYFTQSGNYANAANYFTAEVNNPPLRALANSDPDGPNGVFYYGAGGGFPTDSFNSGNYWVDVLFTPDAPIDTTPPTVLSVSPTNGASGVNVNNNITARFSEALAEATINGASFELRDASSNLVAAAVSYDAATRTATLDPGAALAYSTTYSAVIKGGAGGVSDLAGNELATDFTWTFTTAAPPPPPPYEGPGGPILVVTSTGNPFSTYFAEILRMEGLNVFAVADITTVNAALLNNYDVVILGEMTLTGAQVTLLTDWVTAGGNLIAMRPDKQLAGLLGLADANAALANAYLLVNTTSGPGVGIVDQTIQFHGPADLYILNGAAALATIYADATTATSNPAVTLVNVGTNGGQAAAFTYDLAKSVVYTRQGNPAWIDINGDNNSGPVRSDDLFHNGTDPDWVNLNKVAIPQADEQQRLLANMITSMNLDNLPLPRFWYFPRGEQAVVVMTHDEHGGGNIVSRLDYYNQQSPVDCNLADWECIRSTTYMYTNAQITNAQVAAYQTQGHEFNVHINTNCDNYTSAQLEAYYTNQIPAFSAVFPSVGPQTTQRTHCIAWSGWAVQPTVQLQNGMRLDTNYYYWPDAWIQNRPGLFTGSGMPMRFADLDGTMIDVYQATTQMTDESGQTYPFTIDTLLDNALGPNGYYGAFTANIHTDGGANATQNAQAIVQSAQARSVPVITARQLLTWLDGRNGSAFGSLNWTANTLSFSTSIGAGANGLQVMVPAQAAGGIVSSITIAGSPVSYSLQTIKGIQYAIFDASAGTVDVSYAEDTTPPVVSSVSPPNTVVQVPTGSVVTVTFNEPMDAATINTNTFELRAPGNVLVAAAVTYNAATNTARLTPNAALDLNSSYSATIVGGASGMTDAAGNPLAANFTWSFTTAADNCPCSIWDNTATPANSPVNDGQPIEVGTKFRSEAAGYITSLRFYKGAGDTDTHVGHLWASSGGSPLATVTFTNETASGWQEMALPTPAPINANTTYIVSIFSSPAGYFSITPNYFTGAVNNPPLRALASGEEGPNGVYAYGGGFPTSGNNSNYWVDVVFELTISEDTTPPIISNVSAAPAANGTAVITWNTDEPATSLVGYGTTSGALNLSESSAASVTSHSILLTGLAANTTYYYIVTSVDAANNSATSTEYSFITPAQVLTDTSPADFGAAAANSCYIAEIADGEVILPPTVGAEFDGTALPAGWSSTPWTGGASTVSGGQLSVDGALARLDTYYTYGRALEFAATFGNETFQNIGFGQLLANQTGEYWAMFGIGATANGLYARTNNNGAVTDTLLAGSWLGAPHHYRIEWDASQILFYIDGSLVHTANVAITQTMRPVISDYQVGGASVNVNWLHMSPYSSPCSLTSRVFDAGETVIWDTMSWSSVVPASTSLGMSYRIGNSPTPDGSWSAFTPVGSSPASLGGSSRYIQYRADLANTDDSQTPVLQDVSFASHIGADTTPPTITGRSPVPDATAVAWDTAVTATFSEAMNAATLTDTTFTLRASGAGSDMPAVVTYANGVVTLTPTANLQGGTLYLVTVSGSVTDLAGNPLGDDDTWSFTTTDQSSLTDTTVADFNAGTIGACFVDGSIGDGALRLSPALNEAFSGTILPDGWSYHVWSSGAPVVQDGSLVVNGQVARYDTQFGPGKTLEFRATFAAESFQHAGFGGADPTYNDVPWIMFSTGSTGSQLYTRVAVPSSSDSVFGIGSGYLGAPHIYRIEWNLNSINFFIDGNLVDSRSITLDAPMRIAVSDVNNNATSLAVDWLRMSPPYASPCTFDSRVFDAAVVVDWLDAQWLGTTPAGAMVTVETRTGDSATPNGGWSAWQAVDVGGTIVSPNGRYAQYRLTLSTTDVNATPIIEEVTLRYSVDIAEIAQFTGFVDLQGRANDSGAVVEVFDIANKASSTLLASGASAAGGGYTTAFHGTRQLEVGARYYLQINRPLFLPTTILVADDWQHWAALVERPLTMLNTVVLLGGDATNDNIIDLNDAACIGGQYGRPTPDVCGAGLADVTGDGAVNIIDLTLMGGNYGKNFSPWNP